LTSERWNRYDAVIAMALGLSDDFVSERSLKDVGISTFVAV
jgi:hypothetical protein